ncbi:MAG: hypothetical protein ATN35_00170 [Epulopiscium sp. Nele67-Bin004]|nr:MAG: hypothetical protein ATN35_00170 [Epulopiscium sp. Nele67-Bin004]
MVRGLYMASTGMLLQTARMDAISNDLANTNTTGYKKDVVVAESFEDVLIKRLGGTNQDIKPLVDVGYMSFGVKVSDVYTQFAQGSLIMTTSKTDLALQGDGFFVIDTGAEEMYTRDGAFEINQYSQLVTQEGYAVMGLEGPIQVMEDIEDGVLNVEASLDIRENGDVYFGGEFIDTIRVVNVDDPQLLEKRTDDLFALGTAQLEESDALVISSYLEASNVNVVQGMVDMITVSRSYEASQKLVQVHDDLLNKAINEVGRA